MFTIQVWFDNRWKDGIRFYDTIEAANSRLKRLNEVGIRARVKLVTDD